MESRRVLLLSVQPLLSESLAQVLGRVEAVDLIGPYVLKDYTLTQLADEKPDMVLIAEQEDEREEETRFVARILEYYPDLPVIQVGLNSSVIRVYTSHTLPARSADLIDTIHSLPSRQHGC